MIDSDHLFAHVIYEEVFFVLVFILTFFYMLSWNALQTYPREFELCICVQVWGDHPCPMYEIINYNITMLHFVCSIMSHATLIMLY